MGGNRRIVPEQPLHKYEKSRVVDGGKYRVVLVPGLGGWPMPEGYYGAASTETYEKEMLFYRYLQEFPNPLTESAMMGY